MDSARKQVGRADPRNAVDVETIVDPKGFIDRSVDSGNAGSERRHRLSFETGPSILPPHRVLPSVAKSDRCNLGVFREGGERKSWIGLSIVFAKPGLRTQRHLARSSDCAGKSTVIGCLGRSCVRIDDNCLGSSDRGCRSTPAWRAPRPIVACEDVFRNLDTQSRPAGCCASICAGASLSIARRFGCPNINASNTVHTALRLAERSCDWRFCRHDFPSACRHRLKGTIGNPA